MPRPARVTSSLLLSLFSLGACRAWHVESTPAPEVIRASHPSVIRVTRVSDSSEVVLYTPSIQGDSLRGLPTELAVRPMSVPLDDIGQVATKQFSWGKTLLLGLAIVGGLVLYELLQSLNETSF